MEIKFPYLEKHGSRDTEKDPFSKRESRMKERQNKHWDEAFSRGWEVGRELGKGGNKKESKQLPCKHSDIKR